MKFQLAINLERMDASLDMREVARHTLEMVQMAEDGGFHIAWAAEHHALEMTIAPDPFQILTWWGAHTSKIRLGTAVVTAAAFGGAAEPQTGEEAEGLSLTTTFTTVMPAKAGIPLGAGTAGLRLSPE